MQLARPVVAAAVVVALAAGCGSKKSTPKAQSTPRPQVVKTAPEWAQRVVDLYLRPLNKDLQVLNAINVPDIRIYILSAEPATIKVLTKRMHSLHSCSGRLDRVGAPPPGQPRYVRIANDLDLACKQYTKLTDILLEALPLLSSGDPAQQQKGQKIFNTLYGPSKQAAADMGSAIRLMQQDAYFRRAGVGTG